MSYKERKQLRKIFKDSQRVKKMEEHERKFAKIQKEKQNTINGE